MDKESVVKLLLEHMHWHNGEWAIGGRLGLGELAEAIAQAHEEELDELRESIENLVKAANEGIDEEWKAKAQVAVMAEALVAHDAWMKRIYPPSVFTGVSGDEGVLEVVALREQAEQALQSAPKVLWRGKAVFDWDGTMPSLYLDDEPNPDGFVSGDLYDVIVLEGPNALQEQSKAAMPDGECSVNEGCQPKGKQVSTSCTYCPDPVFMPGWKVCARHSGMQHQPVKTKSEQEE